MSRRTTCWILRAIIVFQLALAAINGVVYALEGEIISLIAGVVILLLTGFTFRLLRWTEAKWAELDALKHGAQEERLHRGGPES